MRFAPFRRPLAWPSTDRVLLVALLLLLAAYAVVLFVAPSAVGRGGR